MTITEAAVALRARRISATELTSMALDRITKLDPKLNALKNWPKASIAARCTGFRWL